MGTRQGRMHLEESLKIPKGISEVVSRRADNAVAKRKRTKPDPQILKA